MAEIKISWFEIQSLILIKTKKSSIRNSNSMQGGTVYNFVLDLRPFELKRKIKATVLDLRHLKKDWILDC